MQRDYRAGIRSVIHTYGGNVDFLVKAIQDLIVTAVENEGARLLAEAEEKLHYPVCPQCKMVVEIPHQAVGDEVV